MPEGLGTLSKSLSKTCSTRSSILERCQHPPYFAIGTTSRAIAKQARTNASARGEDTRRDKHFGLDRINIDLLHTIYRRAYCLALNVFIAATRVLSPVITQLGDRVVKAERPRQCP